MKNRVALNKATDKKITPKEQPTFANMWKLRYKTLKGFTDALAKTGDDEFRAYAAYTDGEPQKLLTLVAEDLDAMAKILKGQQVNVYGLYMKALVAYGLNKAGTEVIDQLRKRFKRETVNSWLTQHSLPSDKTLLALEDEFDLDLLKYSVVPQSEFAKPTGAKDESAVDEKPVKAQGKKSLPPLSEDDKKNAPVGGAKTVVEKVKKPSFVFSNVWLEHHSDLEAYCDTTFNRREADIYAHVVEGDSDMLNEFSGSMLDAMQDKHPRQQIDVLYRKAVLQRNYARLSPEQHAEIQQMFSAAPVGRWLSDNMASLPSYDALNDMHDRGIYVMDGSVLDEEFHAPRKAVRAAAFSEGDEIYDFFTKRDLDRVQHLSKDFAAIMDEMPANVHRNVYAELVNGPGFRAMMELWPNTLRHELESEQILDEDGARVWWNLETCNFKARVTENRAEVFVEESGGGYVMYANTKGLCESVEQVFRLFDVMTSDQLGEIMHKNLGFENDHVAGVEFHLESKTNYTPAAFYDQAYSNEITITGNGNLYSASQFLLLAAQTTRGIVMRKANAVERFAAFNLHVGEEAEFHVLNLDTMAANGPTKGAASYADHINDLAPPFPRGAQLHGAFLNERNELELPLSQAAYNAFHQNNKDADEYMHSIVFI